MSTTDRAAGPAASPEVDEYIDGFTGEVAERLTAMRQVIRDTAPDAAERISWSMPTYDLARGIQVHFAGYKRHIGFYPQPDAIEAFADELREYKSSKGAVQFPLDRPLPVGLVRRVVQWKLDRAAREGD